MSESRPLLHDKKLDSRVPDISLRRVPAEGESLSRQPHRTSPADYLIDPKTGCWEWQKTLTKLGYGTGSFLSAGIQTNHAHRAYYIAANGPIPEGLHIHHRCSNHRCVNPAHLEAVEQPDHTGAHQRFISTLNWDKVREIREMAGRGVGLDAVMERFGIGRTDAFYVIANQRWIDPDYVPGWVVTCEWCGESFRTMRSNKRFCKRACRYASNSSRTWERTKARRAA